MTRIKLHCKNVTTGMFLYCKIKYTENIHCTEHNNLNFKVKYNVAIQTKKIIHNTGYPQSLSFIKSLNQIMTMEWIEADQFTSVDTMV